ncbi:hypothetical protein [Candidatus Poriferisodalis sp.]|uniref:hypothetical protein n=1 Tax=Candidatus Poriferisodalis sp. TaxID=3101277 RepID=UPI003B5C3528
MTEDQAASDAAIGIARFIAVTALNGMALEKAQGVVEQLREALEGSGPDDFFGPDMRAQFDNLISFGFSVADRIETAIRDAEAQGHAFLRVGSGLLAPPTARAIFPAATTD